MPGRDRTGPAGEGAGTGRRMGDCFPNEGGYFARRPFGLGPGRRRGWGGRGMMPRWGRWQGCYAEDYQPMDEKEALEEEKSWLQRQLDSINNRLDSISKDRE